jgi:hypothetical protein
MIARRVAWGALALVTAVLIAGAGAGPVTDRLRPSIDRITAILADPALTGAAMAGPRRGAQRQIMDEAVDFREAARRARGRTSPSITVCTGWVTAGSSTTSRSVG